PGGMHAGLRSPVRGSRHTGADGDGGGMNTTAVPHRTTVAAAIASAALLVQAMIWLLSPGLNPYVDDNLSALRAVMPLTWHSWLLAVLGLAGTLGAGIAALRPDNGAA